MGRNSQEGKCNKEDIHTHIFTGVQQDRWSQAQQPGKCSSLESIDKVLLIADLSLATVKSRRAPTQNEEIISEKREVNNHKYLARKTGWTVSRGEVPL